MRKLLLFLFIASSLLSESIKHREPPFFIPKYRIEILSYIESVENIKESRLYFKRRSGLDFHYIKMKCKRGVCKGIIPSPNIDVKSVDYFIETLLSSNRLLTTKVFSISRYGEPYWIVKRGQDSVTIYSGSGENYRNETLNSSYTSLDGFKDKIVISGDSGPYSLNKKRQDKVYKRRDSEEDLSPLFTP